MTAARPESDERFTLIGELGAGSSGAVYRVRDQRDGVEVALKVLRRLGGADLYRFKREFRSLAGLVHPSLAQLHELYAVGDEWMYTMELVDGVPFDRWVRPAPADDDVDTDVGEGTTVLPRGGGDRGLLDLARLRGALAQLADGLFGLHAAGKIHRDLKPTNVLVTPAGRVVILDFGLVTDAIRTDVTHDGKAIGTVAYMSPEQAADVPLTPASDWYAFGVMLYEALCGARPFRGAASDVLRRKQLEEPPPPSRGAAGVPADLDALCVGLLARDPAARPDGVQVLAALGLTPSEASRALAARPVARPVAAPALVALRDALVASRARFVTTVVRGGAGAGKTALCEQFVEEAEATFGARLLIARNDGREQSRFPGLDQVIDQLGGVLLALPAELLAEVAPLALPIARVFPTLRRVPALRVPALPGAAVADPAQLLDRALAGFRAVLARLAVDRPVVIWLDGGEHTTAAGAASFRRLLEVADLPRALFVMCHRSEPDAPTLALDEVRHWGERGGDLRTIDLDVAPA